MHLNELKASDIAVFMFENSSWLEQQGNPQKIVDECLIDGEIQSIDISMRLKVRGRHELALRLLDRVRAKYPKGDITYYESALNVAMLGNFNKAIEYAVLSIKYAPEKMNHRSFLARLYALSGDADRAKKTLGLFSRKSAAYRNEASELAQFIDFCEAWPLSQARETLTELEHCGVYVDAKGLGNAILTAIRDSRPYSFVRLGDGEGAWLPVDSYDEGKYSHLYRSNRVSFLNDWFGSSNLIDHDGFNDFCQNLAIGIPMHDAIGIPPFARLDQEEGFVSIRGIPSSINVFRFLSLYKTLPRQLLCSNSVNLTLAAETNFYSDLLNCDRKFGVITSHAGVRDLLKTRGVCVRSFHLVPGDSRNFHLDHSEMPICQYPEHSQRISQELAAEDMTGTIYLVAAGFVGKHYIKLIRERGGVALDIGSLTDHWMRHGVP